MEPGANRLVGRVFGGYQLQRVIGSGGAGTVYLAVKWDAPEQEVAVKVLMPAPQASAEDLAEFKTRFEREAKALRLLEHPRILALLDYGEDAETSSSYMVLPYMRGGALTARLEQGALPLDDVGRYATEVAEGLDYAHEHGVVHRDIKPGNVLLDEQGRIHLADFGIAKIFDSAGTSVLTLTTTGQVMGTADYMSPEQALGQDVTASSDIYSLAMLVYQLVTGQTAFAGKSLTQVLLQITTTPPIPPRRLRPTLPAPAEAAILRALSKQPVDRFKTAGEFAAALAAGLRDEWAPGLRQAATVDTFVPQETIAAPRDERRRDGGSLARPPVLIAGMSALLIVAITGTLLLTGFFTHDPGGSSPPPNPGSSTVTNAFVSATTLPTLTATAAATATARRSGGSQLPTPTPTPTPASTPTWGSWTQVASGTTNAGPAATTYGGLIYYFAKGINDHGIYWGTYDGSNFIGGGQIGTLTTNYGLAATVYNNLLYLFATGSDSHGYVTVFSGSSWGSWTQVASGTTNAGPAATTYGGLIYYFAKGINDHGIYWGTYDGSNFIGGGQIGTLTTNYGLAATVYNNLLYLFATGSDSHGYVTVFSGSSWGSWTQYSPGTTDAGPAATTNRGLNYVFGKGINDHGIYWGTYDGSNFIGGGQIGTLTTNYGLAATVYNNLLYLFATGSDSHGYVTVYR